MDMSLTDVIEFLQATLRSVGAEVTSPWFYLQFGLILAAFGIAFAADAAIRARVDMNSLATPSGRRRCSASPTCWPADRFHGRCSRSCWS